MSISASFVYAYYYCALVTDLFVESARVNTEVFTRQLHQPWAVQSHPAADAFPAGAALHLLFSTETPLNSTKVLKIHLRLEKDEGGVIHLTVRKRRARRSQRRK